MLDWTKYPNFTKEEFDCKYTGDNKMRPEFLEALQLIRDAYGRPMEISSGYRSMLHPVEIGKKIPGEHTKGLAVDIEVSGTDALDLVAIAHAHGIRRIGLHQKGNGRFIHLGMGDKLADFPAAIWTY